MSDDWKYKKLPRASGEVAPAKWDPTLKEWVPYTTVDKIEVDNLPDIQKVEITNDNDPVVFPEDYPDEAVRAELAEIKAAQAEILDRLDGTFDTRVTGSNVAEEVMQERILTAGSTISHLYTAYGVKVGIAISFVGYQSIRHTVVSRPTKEGSYSQVAPDITIVDNSEKPSIISGGSFEPITRHNQLRVRNYDDKDTTVNVAVITHFMAGGISV